MGYFSIWDLGDCEEQTIELLAPMQANTFTEKEQQSEIGAQIPQEKFLWNRAERTYECPAGHPLTYQGRERRARPGGRFLWLYRFQCSVVLRCADCPLAEQCLCAGPRSRAVKRPEGQELLDAQRQKMTTWTLGRLMDNWVRNVVG
jgi:hypothetical protein